MLFASERILKDKFLQLAACFRLVTSCRGFFLFPHNNHSSLENIDIEQIDTE